MTSRKIPKVRQRTNRRVLAEIGKEGIKKKEGRGGRKRNHVRRAAHPKT